MTGVDGLRELTAGRWWTMRQVAWALAWKVQSVRALRAEGGMPEPDEMAAQRPLWLPATVVWWAVQTGRMDGDTGQPLRIKPSGRTRRLPRCPTCDQALPDGYVAAREGAGG